MKLRTDAALFALLACFAACVAAAAPSVTSTDSVGIPVGDLNTNAR